MEDIEIRDEFEGGNEQTLSMNEIVFRHIRKISDLSCKEFTGGFWEKKPVRTANGVMFSEVWHEDVREAYCNAVDFLVDILYPKAKDKNDNDFINYIKEFENYKEKVTKDNKKEDEEEKKDIKQKMKLKRQTFQQINLMLERIAFGAGSGSYNE